MEGIALEKSDKEVMMPKTVTYKDVIQRAPYLLGVQKERLLRELNDMKIISKDVLKDYMLEAIEEVCYRILGVSSQDLSATERNEIERVVAEIIENPREPSLIWKHQPIPVIGEGSGV